MKNITERILAFNKDRLPDMVKLKYEGMAENIYRFYRGTCHLFYEDLCKVKDIPVSPLTWICGDLHLENYGSYKGDNRLAYFDLNDFDEALLAPCLWEAARMVTSIFIAFNDLKIAPDEALEMAKLFLSKYAGRLATGKAISIDPRTAGGIVCSFLTMADERKQKELLNKLTVENKHRLILLTNVNHFTIDKKLKKELIQFVNEWLGKSIVASFGFEAIDCVFRIAGTGSIGVRRYMFLLKSSKKKNKYLLLDMKQSKKSSVQPYLDVKQPGWQTESVRVIQVQQRMQNISPALLDAVTFKNDSYVMKELQPTEDRINFELIKDRYGDISLVIEDMALLAASSQLRSSGRQNSAIADKLIAFGKDDRWQEVVLKYAQQYAKQVKIDYKEYMEAYKAGKFK
jgi:uncharacterized protein (DUF2252 family)